MSSQIVESANLILSTQSPQYTPTINAAYSFITFNNVDLKNILGEMFDKYDLFVLKPVSYSTFGTITYGSGSQTGILNWNMRGLSWRNMNYEFTPNQQQWCNIFNCNLSNSSSTQNFMNRNNGYGYTFRKDKRIVNLDLCIAGSSSLGVGQDFLPPAGNTWSNFTMAFTIEPVIKGVCNECAFWGFNANVAQTAINRVVTNGNRIYSYYGFDMKTLCQEFWDDYEDFEIQMYAANTRGPGTLTGNTNLGNIEISGLNFVNNLTKQGNDTTNPQSNFSTANAIVSTIKFGVSGSDHPSFPPFTNHSVQFKKSGDRVNLVLKCKNMENTDLLDFTFTTAGTQHFFLFSVRPVYKQNKATLFINPWGLTVAQTNAGIRQGSYQYFTLKNIDMRQVCQSMWDKYKKFNIYLQQTLCPLNTGNNTNQGFNLQMEGFDFVNQTAWITETGQTEKALLGQMIVPYTVTFQDIYAYDNSLMTTFYKTKDIVDITLTALPYSTSHPFIVSHNPLAQNFIFTIIGVEEE